MEWRNTDPREHFVGTIVIYANQMAEIAWVHPNGDIELGGPLYGGQRENPEWIYPTDRWEPNYHWIEAPEQRSELRGGRS